MEEEEGAGAGAGLLQGAALRLFNFIKSTDLLHIFENLFHETARKFIKP